MFRNAIVRLPGPSIVNGLTSGSSEKPDYQTALKQHAAYVEALKIAGLSVTVLGEDDLYPDSAFIEDVALCASGFAVITSPGAISRRGETRNIRKTLEVFFRTIEEVSLPGTLEAGDVMMTGSHFFIGISNRTNTAGAAQLIQILKKHGMTGSVIPMKKMLHLKSGASYLENNNMLVAGELIDCSDFEKYNRIIVGPSEIYAANSLWINETVLVPSGYPETLAKIENAGYKTIVLDVSEFRKVDGGLSCLSLRF